MKLIVSITLLLVFTISVNAQIANAKQETFTVYGNCEMCKTKIEKASTQKKVSKGVWDEKTHKLSLTYDNKKTSPEKVLKKIALAGYDNEKFYAPNTAYNKLPACCKYDRPKTETAETVVTTTNSSNLTPSKKPLTDVYSAYFALKDALVKSDGNTTSLKAKELFKAIDAVKMDGLTTKEHTVWMAYSTKLSYDAEHIKSTTELEHQREHFITLSKNMYEVMKEIKADAPIYYEHCPMANNGKGANWLSLESVIKNPYYGSQMLNCGKVEETIK